MLKKLCLTVWIVLIGIPSFAQTSLPSLFGNNMVLQQNDNVRIWGTDTPNVELRITGSWGSEEITKADKNGKWHVYLQTPSAGGPYEVVIDGSETHTLSDVLIGEVWLASGQSNMVMPLKGFKNQPVEGSEEAILNSKNRQIRFFNVEKNASLEPLYEVQGSWEEAIPETAGELSATAYFFGEKIGNVLDVPVGLIVTAWGGSRIEAWMDTETLDKFKNTEALDELPEKRIAKQPSLLYKAMVHPLISFNIKGIIWYQGEANRKNPEDYKSLFPAMIKSWRNMWQNKSLPFYFAQIAPFGYKDANSAFLREAQLTVMREVEHTGMASTLDIGDCDNIHPAQKKEVGERLALWALSKDYNVYTGSYSGPVYKYMKGTENNRIQLYFDHVDGGLTSLGKKLTGFTIAGKDKIFHTANATINSNGTIFVWAEGVEQPVAVRYAFENCPEASLFNEAGLPASSFRTDHF